MYKIGVDIGGTKINVGIISGDGKLLSNKKILISDITDIASSVSDAVAELENEIGIKADDISSCGIGIPGTVSEDGKKVIKSPNIEILHENIADEIYAAFYPVLRISTQRKCSPKHDKHYGKENREAEFGACHNLVNSMRLVFFLIFAAGEGFCESTCDKTVFFSGNHRCDVFTTVE